MFRRKCFSLASLSACRALLLCDRLPAGHAQSAALQALRRDRLLRRWPLRAAHHRGYRRARQLRVDLPRFTGKENGKDIDYFPIQITRADVERGHERFNIYCSPCHGRLGDGHGMIVSRGLRQPPSYHDERLRNCAGRTLFRRYDKWLRRDVQLRVARSGR